ncbi:DNA mismatch repair endonuclease MutL [Clostridium fallax]|uniref:DNA mismatch repair protein MutL n=1 Tax=Clostridium fallax TaxID=1533 RepID=A0A1M4Z9G7_9CLOT|nr:DNA mismatch repair endonuclease MutL [Clostridium fallax]SHF14588.1 DNA mismatch repair protein MutL [Clostridium fallax]SQB06431.1 DNA mismatch repair protein MutL [Clostridium fallax]
MKRINLLDEVTSNKIAAGEVVERPSSVVKELIENSIDAGSKNIIIEIEEGGKDLIRIIDDGYGIHPDDIEKAFLPHATSKIKDIKDIYAINTLGFRGEALASIASVAKVSLKSKMEGIDFGKEIYIEGGLKKHIKEIGMNKGTTIEVKELFFNVPARQKFLKSTSRESSIINDIVTRIALCNPNVSFILYNRGKKVLHTFGNGSLEDTIRNIYGKTISNDIIYFENHTDTTSIYGYIGRESIAKGNKNNQSIFVNKRYIKNQLITVAMENAFKSFSTINKHPFFIIFIDIYPELVDVNIHPAKAEVKFTEDRALFKIIFDTVHNKVKEDVMESFSLPEEDREEKIKEPLVEEISFDFKDIVKNKFSSLEEKSKEDLDKVFINNNRFKETLSENHLENKISENTSSVNYINKADVSNCKETISLPVDLKSTVICKEEALNITKDNSEEIKKISPKDYNKFPYIKIIGQFDKTYIIGEYEKELYFIDQHAAHEKILFEKYMKEIESKEVIIQPLLVPEVIELSLSDYCYFEENKDVFKSAGFLVEDFGGNSIMIKEVPYFLQSINAKLLFIDILENLKNLGSGKTTEVKYNKIATMACKSAVKAHDELNLKEMERLLEDLRYLDNPFHCPHGRPTIIKITLNELEKRFRRIQ